MNIITAVKKAFQPGVAVHAYNPSAQELRHRTSLSLKKDSLKYITRTRSGRAKEGDPISKHQNKFANMKCKTWS